ncbi:heterodisulfide reductase subunit A [Desulfonispora thiosulfatigenes DSM 11270]|uniref:Heterodisulfide reductase subunit A n=1 Tax=Desulfonispora thiosulfatigenes DSM 11270 TaxID=656914 RepID=A0A1W1VTN3_DESTI|nr:FAD-dependent oxidoreductase [Desulfonispora thiosulfatigenes]SMB96461.1 heterodisulfide reductase subunit A [Desulfonispora thiosulfatigenes DSM 11270]
MANLKLVPDKIGSVMVVGGGIAGVQSALDLANSGYYVYLIENSSGIGGVMSQLDKTFPTNDCSMCILSPKLVECGRHQNIKLLTLSQVEEITGDAGNFTVKVSQKPRYVDMDKCVGCGSCAEACPTKVLDFYDEGLRTKKAISVKYQQTVPLVYSIDDTACLYLTKGKPNNKNICRICEKVCNSHAINFDDLEKELEINVGSVILAPGFDEFDPSSLPQYGYGKFKNVITTIEFERIMSASGPYEGHIVRPSDRKEPKKVAWLQCIGSRDEKCGNGYCSSVCCTYAIKEAIIAKEHNGPELETTIFYMDVRTFGKDFEQYYQRSKNEHGVRYINSKIHSLEEDPETQNIRIRYASEDGQVKYEEFDIVVLSVGLTPSKSAVEMAKKLDLKLNKYNFIDTEVFNPVQTSKEGIFACGAFQSPQDIPATVVQASAAAGAAASALTEARNTLVSEVEYPLEQDVVGKEPRVGVFVCHCGINIGATVDVPSVSEYVKDLKHVAYADHLLYSCSQDAQEKIKDLIKEHDLNRVVVASCTPRTHEALFQQTLKEAGLNPYLFEMANIREQCSWVHMNQPAEATAKAKDLVRKAVARAALKDPLQTATLSVNKEGLVVGGGVAGMVSALEIANQGYQVHLIEKGNELGGVARNIYFNVENSDVQSYLADLIKKVENNPLIKVYKNSTITDVSGYVGNFFTTIQTKNGLKELNHGVVVLAIGGKEYEPKEYLYGNNNKVVTSLSLEQQIIENPDQFKDMNTVMMIQCIGSRNDENKYCSRVCCAKSVKNALKLKEINPDLNVFVLYRDMRTYGFKEDQYREARKKGVMFVRFDQEDAPRVTEENGQLQVTVKDPILSQYITFSPDRLALAAGVLPDSNAKQLAQFYKVPLNDDGFFLEAHMKLRPVDFATEGVFVTGLAHSPKFIEETIAQSQAAANRACVVLAKDELTSEGAISYIDANYCIGCKICVDLCPYKAISFNEEFKIAEVNDVLCKGCGVCASACPSGACNIKNFRDDQIFTEISAIFA